MIRRSATGRVVAVVGFVLVLSAVPAGLRGGAGDVARAQEFGGFGGYQISASGMGLTVAPTVPAVLPVETPAEATLALATATLSTGGTGWGQASSVFPGPLLANLRPLLETGAGVELPIPDYPLVVESREHEDAKTSRVPGITMSSNVNPDKAVVTSDLGGLTLPGILDVGNIRTVSTASVTDGLARAETRAEVTGVTLLAGAVHIDSIVTTATSTSDSETSTCDGGVRVTGASVGGRSVSIDEKGVSAEGEPVIPLVDPNEAVLAVLDELGFRMRVLGALKACDGARSDVTTRGLLVSVPLPEVGPLPPGGSLNLVIGSASTVTNATPIFEFELPEVTTPPSGGDVAPPAATGGFVPNPTPAAPSTDVATTPPAPSTVSPTPPQPAAEFRPANFDYDFGGVPTGMVLGLMLLAVPASKSMSRYLRRVIAMVS